MVFCSSAARVDGTKNWDEDKQKKTPIACQSMPEFVPAEYINMPKK